MREIKFRGYSKEDNQWHYGYYIKIERGTEILDRHPGDGSVRGNSVEEASIGQYTGFKDKNGVEIYEGDLVKELEEDADSYYVEFDEEYGIWQVYDVIQKCQMFNLGLKQMIINNCKIVGNIYENNLKEEK